MEKNNIAIVLNKQRASKKGEYPLRIRTTIKREVTYYKTGIMVTQDQWDGFKIINHPSKVLLNTLLRNKLNLLERDLLEFAITGKDMLIVKKNITLTFNEYAVKKIKGWTGSYSTDTIKHRWHFLGRVNECLPGIKLIDITSDCLLVVEKYCRKLGNSKNTVVSYTKFIKTIINAAVSDKIIASSPLINATCIKYKNPLRQSVTVEELNELEIFADNLENTKFLRTVASYFILSSYCGLRYSDIKAFNGIENDKIFILTEKTGQPVSMIATPQIKASVARLIKKIPSNQKCNDALKTIFDRLKIKKNITFHCARHSFGCNYMLHGGRLEVLQRLMGHASIKTTAIYGKISDVISNKEMIKVWGEAKIA